MLLVVRKFTSLACISCSNILLAIGKMEIGLSLDRTNFDQPLYKGTTKAYFMPSFRHGKKTF